MGRGGAVRATRVCRARVNRRTRVELRISMKDFFVCFIQMFVAVDAIGVLPLFVALTEELTPRRKRTVVIQSVSTATIVAIVFLLAGPHILRLLAITVPDFMVAGGLLLFVIAMGHILGDRRHVGKSDFDTLGAVPIGVPLITGPAVLTTGLLLMSQHSVGVVILATAVNTVLAGMMFVAAGAIARLLGHAGVRTVSKIAELLLASIAVMMVRRGLFFMVREFMEK